MRGRESGIRRGSRGVFACGRGGGAPRVAQGPHGVGAFVGQQQYSLGQIEGAGRRIGGDGDQLLAVGDFCIVQAAVFGAEDQGNALTTRQGRRNQSAGLRRRKQGPAPAAHPGR